MTATADDLIALLERLAILTTTHRHPPVFTVEQAGALRGDLPGRHAKNLFLKDKKGALFLVVADEHRAVELKDLRRRLGAATLSFAKPDLLRQVLGVDPGSVTPFALINDVERRVFVVLDSGLMRCDPLNFHPLRNDATTAIAPADLLTFIHACGHRPQVIDLDAEIAPSVEAG